MKLFNSIRYVSYKGWTSKNNNWGKSKFDRLLLILLGSTVSKFLINYYYSTPIIMCNFFQNCFISFFFLYSRFFLQINFTCFSILISFYPQENRGTFDVPQIGNKHNVYTLTPNFYFYVLQIMAT